MIVNKYLVGSHLYKTNDLYSDEDYIIVVSDIQDKDTSNDNIQYFTIDEFQHLLSQMDIKALECLFAPTEYVLLHNHDFTFICNTEKLRKSISSISSNSYVKAKKKLIVDDSYNLRIGLKSFFHSFRILDFGIQILKYGKIVNYCSMNYIYDDIQQKSISLSKNDLWIKIHSDYKPLYNKMKTEFRLLSK